MLLLVAAEKEVVVRELPILAIKAQFDHEAGTGGFEFLFQRRDESLVLVEQLLVGGDHFHVRYDDVGGVERDAARGRRRVAVEDVDLGAEARQAICDPAADPPRATGHDRRAAVEAEASRDMTLFELGERLYVDRPAILGAQLSSIDRIDLELGEGDRRVMELREILSNVDKAKLARGMTMIVLACVAVGGFIAWMAHMLAG